MSRLTFGGGIADWTLTVGSGDEVFVAPNAEVTFWDAQTGGNMITDLRDANNNPVTTIDSDSIGQIPLFYGPDETPPRTYMWAEAGAGPRALVTAVNSYASLADRLTALEQVAFAGHKTYDGWVDTYQSRSSTAYGNLGTVGPVVSNVPITNSGKAIIGLYSYFESSANGSEGFMSVEVSGATTVAPVDGNSISHRRDTGSSATQRLGGSFVLSGLNEGNHTFTARYRRTVSGSYWFAGRKLFVTPLPAV